MTVGATNDEIKWQLGEQLATSEYRMCGGMDSSNSKYDCEYRQDRIVGVSSQG